MKTTRFIVRSSVIAALYAALTLVLALVAYGPVQFRVSEALTILPLFFPEAIPGLFVGCFIANIPSGLWDMVIGSAATLIAAVATRFSKKNRLRHNSARRRKRFSRARHFSYDARDYRAVLV